MRTNIATQNFSSLERLIFAITDDDVSTFDRLGIPLEDLANLEFEGGANVLNFAIENERIAIVQHLAVLTKERPMIRRSLLEHRFRMDQISAVHQVMSIGNRNLINVLLHDFEASLEMTTQNKLTVMHCAAQQYYGYLSMLVLHEECGFDVNVRDNF